MAFTGLDIFPGLTVRGVVDPGLQDLVSAFNLECLSAMQQPAEEKLGWTEICGVTPAVFKGKIPLDLTALDGFEPFEGVRHYKQIDVIALEADVNQWQRGINFDERLQRPDNSTLSDIFAAPTQAQNLIRHARVMKARLAASVFMKGYGSSAAAKVYVGNSIPGAGLPLFSNAATTGAHYANPIDPKSRTFDNLYTAAGKFNDTSFAATRANMQYVPSPTFGAEDLGLEVTDIIGPTHMAEPFRQVMLANLVLHAGTGAAAAGVAAVTNVYAAGSTPCRYWIAPQLNNDPYLATYKAAHSGWKPTDLPHMWIAVSRTIPGIRPVEMVAPTKEFTPLITIFGEGSELAAQTRKIHYNADLDAGAAAGLPHSCALYQET